MTPLALRKQLLVAESELQRAQLAAQLNDCGAIVRGMIDRSSTYGSMLSSGATLLTGLASFQAGPAPGTAPRLSWLPGVLKVAGVVSTIWLAMRSRKKATARSLTPDHSHVPPTSSLHRP